MWALLFCEQSLLTVVCAASRSASERWCSQTIVASFPFLWCLRWRSLCRRNTHVLKAIGMDDIMIMFHLVSFKL